MAKHPKIQVREDGTLLLNFGRYGEGVEVAAISGDGGRVLTVREVGTAQIWDAHTGHELARLEPTSPLVGVEDEDGMRFMLFIESAALNRDGTLALLGLNDGTAVVYRVDDAERLAVLHEDDVPPASEFGVVRRVRYCGDPELALVGFPSRSVGVWTADGSRRIAWLRPSSAAQLVDEPFVRDTLVTSLALGDDGRTVFAGAVDMTACVFELETGRVLLDAREHAETILRISDDPAGLTWATTAGSVWRASDAETPHKLLATGELWAEVALTSDALLARHYDGSIVRWSFAGERELLVSPRDELERWSTNASALFIADGEMHYPESGRTLVIARGDARTRIVREEQLVRARLSPSKALVTTEGWADALELWDARTGELLQTLPSPGGVGGSDISFDDRLAAVGEIGHGGGLYQRNVYLYAVASGELVHTFTEHQWQVRQVAFSPNAALLASLGDDLIVWDLSTHRVVLRTRLDRAWGRFAFAGDKLVACEPGRVQVFVGARRTACFEAPIAYGVPWTLSHDGRFISIGDQRGVSRFCLETGALDRHLRPSFVLPERVPPLELAHAHGIRGGAALWRTEWGCFLHQSDAPRGWIEPLELSPERLVAIPAEAGAAVLEVGRQSTELCGVVAFTGRLRATRFLDDEVLLVSDEGRLFRAPLRG